MSPADEEERSSEGELGEFGDEMAHVTLKEGVMSAKYLTLDLSLLDLDALPEQSSLGLSDESIPELLDERLELLIAEAQEAEEGALLEPRILNPEAPLLPRPVETSADEAQDESSKGSAGLDSKRPWCVGDCQALYAYSPKRTQHLLHQGQRVQAPLAFERASLESRGVSAALPAPSRYAGAGQTQSRSTPSGHPDYANHPFYHLPAVPSSALVGHAMGRLTKPLKSKDVTQIGHPLSLRFLIADILCCACEALGEVMDKDKWRQPLMKKMLTTIDSWSLEMFTQQRRSKRLQRTMRILGIADIYKSGQLPRPEDVVQIKRMIFCRDNVLPASWREADDSFWAGYK
ncbi:hypothetical protein Esti_006795 [Eimeria stiedai]